MVRHQQSLKFDTDVWMPVAQTLLYALPLLLLLAIDIISSQLTEILGLLVVVLLCCTIFHFAMTGLPGTFTLGEGMLVSQVTLALRILPATFLITSVPDILSVDEVLFSTIILADVHDWLMFMIPCRPVSMCMVWI